MKARLTNHVDHVRARLGEIRTDQIRSYEADALVVAGAVRMIVPPHVLRQLGVETNRGEVAEYADGRKDAVRVSDGITVNIKGRETLDEALVLGDEVLIGQTVLEKLDLQVDCREQRLIANPAHPDKPVSKVK